jgi:uncharacterized protein
VTIAWPSTIGRACAGLWLLALLAPAPLAALTVPNPSTLVRDEAGVIPAAQEARIEALLTRLGVAGLAETKVLTVRSMEGESDVEFAQRHFSAWELGGAGRDLGVLLLLAVDDRRFRIHTGYGLEDALPDSWCGSTSRALRDAYFRAGNYGDGVEQAALAVVRKVAEARGVTLADLPAAAPLARPAPGGGVAIGPILFVLLLLAMAMRGGGRRRRRRGFLGPLIWPGLGGGFGGHGGSFGGGFGGGHGGGFGGFGGGGRSGGGGGGAGW